MLQPRPRLLTRENILPRLIVPGRDGLSPLDRYNARHVKGDGCWVWIGGLNRDGYGQLTVAGFGNIQAHQIAFLIYQGDIPAGHVVMHGECDNPRCCNPAHLVLGTQALNIQDAVAKGRWNSRGSRRVLTPELVRSIRQRHKLGESKDAIARDIGVKRDAVRSAIEGRTWKSVTDEETAA
jgi:uncharacterized protein YjiS (DUF1127 family)